ncbi:MAG: hypothetical protein J0H94_03760 [Rhizobiales bacterium]|nr:hypothetical protein [Hyphomicrobiales bacterium]
MQFFTQDATRWTAGVNEGPYAAMVTRVFPPPAGAAPLVCLTVFPPLLPPYQVSNVPTEADARADAFSSCYWTELPL